MAKRASTTVRYETRTTIDRPIRDVFMRLVDLDEYRTWMHRTGLFRRSGKTSDGPLGLGTAYFDATRMGTFRGEVADYEPPVRIGFRETLHWFGTDLMEARPVFILEADGNKTIVHHVAEGELFGMMRLMKPVAARLAEGERARTVESLKRSLEVDGHPARPPGGVLRTSRLEGTVRERTTPTFISSRHESRNEWDDSSGSARSPSRPMSA
jgi:uncharacterized protein YndB with AHSA1/START domain